MATNRCSKKKLPISVIILTYNEEHNIKECIESVCFWADEVFVVDSGSDDKTLEIAKLYTKNIHTHAFVNFSQQRNWAQDNLPINNEWVFHLDADERVDAKLAKELVAKFSHPTAANGLMVPRKSVFRGKWIAHGDQYPAYQMCIFKRKKGRSEERMYDQNYVVEGDINTIKGDVVNLIPADLVAWRQKHRNWAKLEAQEILFNKNRQLRMSLSNGPIESKNWLRYKLYYRMPLFFRGFAYFFYRLIIKAGFLDGKEGLIYHFWQGLWYRFIVDLELCSLVISKAFNRIKEPII